MAAPYEIDELRRLLSPALARGQARKSILFGSHARGEADEESDVDLAVVAESELPFVERYRQFAAAFERCRSSSCGCTRRLNGKRWRGTRARSTSALSNTASRYRVRGVATQPRAKREARRWQLQAENDLAYARSGLQAGFAAQTCFMAQQVAEKALEAAALGRGDRSLRGHSCARLGQRLATTIAALTALRPALLQLDQFYVPARHPNGLPSGAPFEAYSIEQAQGALATPQEIVDLTRTFLDEACPGQEVEE